MNNINLDLSSREFAHTQLDEIIDKHNAEIKKIRDDDKWSSKPSDNWTEEEINKAIELSKKILCDLFDQSCSCLFYYYYGDKKTTHLRLIKKSTKLPDGGRNFQSTAKGKDIPNIHIGKCVVLCSATNTPIPDFIINKNKREI